MKSADRWDGDRQVKGANFTFKFTVIVIKYTCIAICFVVYSDRCNYSYYFRIKNLLLLYIIFVTPCDEFDF